MVQAHSTILQMSSEALQAALSMNSQKSFKACPDIGKIAEEGAETQPSLLEYLESHRGLKPGMVEAGATTSETLLYQSLPQHQS